MNTRVGFTRKKVESLTLGEKLKKIRQDYHINLGEVAKQTGISAKYLTLLESGEYESLPSNVYVRGFLRSYARFLGADEEALVKCYERERNIHENLQPEDVTSKKREVFRLPRFIVTPRVLIGFGVIIVLLGGFWYLYREYTAFVSAPYLVILEPNTGAVIDGSSVVVRGKTDSEATLTINQQPVTVNGEGEFSELIRLQPGVNTLTLLSKNKFDKEQSETITVQVNETPAPEPEIGN
jgi:cytoskeletal protein RodZ